MGMTQEQAAAAIHAAKLAQKMAMERNLEKLPPGFLHPQLDISKITNPDGNSKNLNLPSVTIEPASNNSAAHKSLSSSGSLDIRRSDGSDREDHHHHHAQQQHQQQQQHQMQQQQHHSMSLNNNSSNNNNNNINNYNKEESSADERNMSDDESIAVN